MMARGRLTEPYIQAVDFFISGAEAAAGISDKVFPQKPYEFLIFPTVHY